jgi:peptidyl-prolyl cis-trans isomerase D
MLYPPLFFTRDSYTAFTYPKQRISKKILQFTGDYTRYTRHDSDVLTNGHETGGKEFSMLQIMRKHARAWFVQVILGIIIIVFIFYFGSLRSGRQTETLAIVNDRAISYIEFRNEYTRLLEFYRERFKDSLTDELLDSLNLKQRALDTIINEAVMLAKADDYHLDVSDEEIRESIYSFPPFQRDGSFDPNLYHRMLRYNKMSPEDFEMIQRRTLKIQKLERLIREGVRVSDEEVFDIYRIQNEKININFISIPETFFINSMKPTDDELRKYFEDHRESFRIPETIEIAALAFPGKDYAKTVEISEETIVDYYNGNKNDFTTSEGKIKSLSDVREAIKNILSLSEGLDRAAAVARTANDIVYQEQNFDEYARDNKIKVQTFPPVSRGDVPPGVSGIENIEKYIFDMKAGETTPVLSDGQAFYIVKVQKIMPSYIPGFEDVKSNVRTHYVREESRDKARQKADHILSELKKGEPLRAVAAKERVAVRETGPFLPGAAIPLIGTSVELARELLVLSSREPYPEKPSFINGDYIIASFKDREQIDFKELDDAQKNEMKNYLQKMKGEEYFRRWLESIKAAMVKDGTLKITVDMEKL